MFSREKLAEMLTEGLLLVQVIGLAVNKVIGEPLIIEAHRIMDKA
jgi:hypothetical protein